MTLYYSFDLPGFCDDRYMDPIPHDAVEIEWDTRTHLTNGESNGQIIVRGADGKPTLADPPPPTPEQIANRNAITQSNLLEDASRKMAPVLVSLQLGDATDQETGIAKSWQAYYRALKLVDLTVASPAWPDPPATA